MRTRIAVFVTLVVVAFSAYGFGVLSGKAGYWPVGRGYLAILLNSDDAKQEPAANKEPVTGVDYNILARSLNWPTVDAYSHVEAREIFRISNIQDAENLRLKIVELVWGAVHIDTHQASSVLDTKVPELSSSGQQPVAPNDPIAKSLAGPQQLANRFAATVTTLGWQDHPIGLDGEAYYLARKEGATCLVVYADGHHDGVWTAEDGSDAIILRALESGCDVVIVPMVGLGLNKESIRFESSVGTFRFTANHNPFLYLKVSTGSPIKYFLDPVRTALNWALARQHYSRIGMVGLSGGAWATSAYSALALRIDFSLAVAGSLPMVMRAVDGRNWGDWEQYERSLYEAAPWGDIYLLAGTGKIGRKAVLGYNQFDTCCFGGGAGSALQKLLAEKSVEVNSDVAVLVDKTSFHHAIGPDFISAFSSLLDSSRP